MEERLLKTLPRQSSTATGGTRTRYQAVVMVGDKEGNMGFGVIVKSTKEIATMGVPANAFQKKDFKLFEDHGIWKMWKLYLFVSGFDIVKLWSV